MKEPNEDTYYNRLMDEYLDSLYEEPINEDVFEEDIGE